MRQILYLSLEPEIQEELSADFWQILTAWQLPGEQAYFTNEQQLLNALSNHQGHWLILLLGHPRIPAEVQRLETVFSGYLARVAQLSVSLAVYSWSFNDTLSEHCHKLLHIINNPQRQRQCLACEVEFDPQWSSLPPYRYRLLLCTGARCARRGSARLWKQLTDELARHNLLETPQGALLVKTHCQFPCNHGPIVTLYPGEYWYSIRQIQDVCRLVAQHIKAGTPVEDLLLDLPLLTTSET